MLKKLPWNVYFQLSWKTSLFNFEPERLLDHVKWLDILHKSQIGFLANNHTADHLLTLRTLIDKYVHDHQTKI